MASLRVLRLDAAPEVARRLITGPWPLGFRRRTHVRTTFRDVFYDTSAGALEQRGVDCRLRHAADGSVAWMLRMEARFGLPERRLDAPITDRPATAAFTGGSPLGDWLRAMVDPDALVPSLEMRVDRHTFNLHWWGWHKPAVRVVIDRAEIGEGPGRIELATLALLTDAGMGPAARRLARALQASHGLSPTLGTTIARARQRLTAAEASALADAVHGGRECAVVLARDGAIGLRRSTDGLDVFWGQGTGEAACRRVLNANLGSSQGQVRCLGFLPEQPWRRGLEVWLARRVPQMAEHRPEIEWVPIERALAMAGTARLRAPRALGALQIALQADVMRHHTHGATAPPAAATTDDRYVAGSPERYFDPDLSLLAFNRRVLSLAADARLAPAERLRYLAICGTNLDEFVAVRLGTLKRDVRRDRARAASGSDAPARRLEAARLHLLDLQQDLAQVFDAVRGALEAHGTMVVEWDALTSGERREASRHFFQAIRPRLVPIAVGASHPFPTLRSQGLTLVVALRDTADAVRFGLVTIPASIPRFVSLPGPGRWIAIESLVRGHWSSLFPGADVIESAAFRPIRADAIAYDDQTGTDRLHQVADVVDGRAAQAVVRLDVERDAPDRLKAFLLQEFRFERPDVASDLDRVDIAATAPLVGLGDLRELDKAAAPLMPTRVAGSFATDTAVMEQIRERDRLVHFPYDSFDGSVLRWLREAAEDPAVERMTLSLYRTTAESPVLEALTLAASRGKTVVALVELKARFDEARNIAAATRLLAAGVTVVYGAPGLKLHSKIAQVLRRDADRLRWYSFVGSGNFHPKTARLYTDVGLFTANEAIGSDLAALTDSLTAQVPLPAGAALLTSPGDMLPALLARIQRETTLATAGRPARIRAKLNGLDDLEIIEALYRASAAGVNIWLSVRGLCRLRPGLAGLSDRIVVVSLLGEFLEHARVVEFSNDGDPEYLIGSADWRERNLRRRIEVMAPVTDEAARMRLKRMLDLEGADASAWHLQPDGDWVRSASAPPLSESQARLRATVDQAQPTAIPPVPA